ncbi:MAG: hypothetical protein GY789_20675 [Hyphomicrobiales bacterium]|nr:hypothetical protein [Hyphomicrobiales bacterium]
MAVFWIEVIAALTIPFCFGAVVVERIYNKKGLGLRSIQFLALGTVMPIVLILALESVLAGEAVAAIVGGVVGYLFASVGGPSKNNSDGK